MYSWLIFILEDQNYVTPTGVGSRSDVNFHHPQTMMAGDTIIQAEQLLLQTTCMSRSRLSAGRNQSRTTQNEQATQHRRLLPRRCCSNHGPVCEVVARHTSRLDYALFVKGISA